VKSDNKSLEQAPNPLFLEADILRANSLKAKARGLALERDFDKGFWEGVYVGMQAGVVVLEELANALGFAREVAKAKQTNVIPLVRKQPAQTDPTKPD
jgi:hypothetical protein